MPKEKTPLIIVHGRPLKFYYLRNMLTLADAGAILSRLCPLLCGPKTINDLVDFIVGGYWCHGLEHELLALWIALR